MFNQLLTTITAMIMMTSSALAVDYLIRDSDDHCDILSSEEVYIPGFDYADGDRTFMCIPNEMIEFDLHTWRFKIPNDN